MCVLVAVFLCLSVCLSVCVVNHALTAVPIDFIFCMHIDVMPGSDIGISFSHFCSLKIIYGQYSVLGACNIWPMAKNENAIFGLWLKMKMRALNHTRSLTTPKHRSNRYTDNEAQRAS